MSQTKVEVIKSPIPPIPKSDSCYDRTNDIIYYVRLSNGIIVTKPEDFPKELGKDEVTFGLIG